MASGVQLATAYISLNVRTDGIKKQVSSALDAVGSQGRQVGTSIGSNIAAGIRNHMGSGTLSTMIFAPMELAGVRWAVRAGKAIGSALRTAIAGALGGLGLGAIFGVGGVLSAGLDRLKTLQQSTVQLSLKLSPEEIKNVQKEVREAVEGTPISLDKAMQAVPKAISAGLNSGEVKQLITDLANLTASTGGQASFEQLSVIMEQVRSKTKLTGEEMQQLVDAGVDVRGILKEAFGYDDKTLEKNLKKGKIGANELQQAIQKVYGSVRNADGSFGLAKRMGETFDGAIGNLKASASRLGANFIAAVLGKKADEDPLKDFALGLGNVTDILNTMGAWVTTHRDDIHNVFVRAKDGAVLAYNGVKNVVDWFGKLKQTGQDVGTRIGDAFDDVTAAVDRLWNKINDVVGKVKSGVEGIVTKIKDFVSTAFNSVFGADTPLGKLLAQLGIGMPTASAAATAGGTTGFNPGPMAPSAAAGRIPVDGSNQGLSSVPRFGYDADGNPLTSTSGRGAGGLTAKIPGQSAVGAPIYSGAVTEDTGGAVEPRTAMIQDLIQQKFGDTGAYIGNDYRKPDGPNEHSSGQAADIMVNELGKRSDESIALGNKINKWLIENAAKIGLQYTIWNGMLYRPDGSTQPNPGQGITGNHEDHVHYRVIPGKVDELPQFSSGGPVWGSGTATSDSIPAMLSNGEHVLTAAEVNKMGGQSAVYGFRKALNAGMIPGFAPGGAVDPNQIQDLNDKLADLNNQALVAKAQFDDVMSNEDASESEKMRVSHQLQQTQRQLQQAQTDLPIIAAGGTPPDRSAQNRVFDTTDRLALAQLAQADMNAADDVSLPQKLQTDYAVVQAQRERDQAVAELQGKGTTTDYGGEFLRTMGFIPANAGNTGVAGTSSLSSFIGMGNDVVGGLIDTGASLAQTAASAAMAGASFGGSAAAGPAAGMAASYGIQLAANTAKRLSSYGFQMASIGADSLVEQLFPFGAPRWLGYDYTGFAPQLNVMGAATSTLEKMGSDAITRYFNPNDKPIIPPAPQAPAPVVDAAPQPAPPTPFDAGQELIGPEDPRFVKPPPNPLTPGGGGGSWAKGGAIGVYDNGGILEPGQLAFNASRTPENILTKQQWNSMAAAASTPAKGSGPLVENLYAQDMQDAIRQLEKVKRRDMMQYAGRP